MCTCVEGADPEIGRQGLPLSVTPSPPQQQPSTWEAGNDCSLEGSNEPPKENIDHCLLPPPASQQGTEMERK